MFNGRTRPLWLIGLGVSAVLIVAIVLPRTLAALPGRVRQYLPAGIAVQDAPALPTPLAPPIPQALAPPMLPVLPLMPHDSGTAADILTEAASPSTPHIATLVDLPHGAATVDALEIVAPIATPTATTVVPTATPAYPPAVYLEGVKIIPQKFNNCGPANLSMVLAFYGLPADQLAIAAQIRPNYEDRNVSPEELATYVTEQTELSAKVVVDGDLDLLKQLLAAGIPVIIEQGLLPEGDAGWMGHYLTIYGYDESEQIFFTRDTFLGPWQEDGRESYDSLSSDWQAFNYVMIPIYRDEQWPALENMFAQPEALWQASVERARIAIRADAADAFAWFNLGASHLQLHKLTGDAQQLRQSVASFDQARLIGLPPRMLWYQFAPYEAYLAADRYSDVIALTEATLGSQGGRSVEETYVYRALARRAMGDEQGAAGDLLRAKLLNPDNPVLQRVLGEQP